MKTKYYVMVVHGDIEPELVGPYTTHQERDAKALELRAADGQEKNGLFPMNMRELAGEVVLEVGAYSNAFFDAADDEMKTANHIDGFDRDDLGLSPDF